MHSAHKLPCEWVDILKLFFWLTCFRVCNIFTWSSLVTKFFTTYFIFLCSLVLSSQSYWFYITNFSVLCHLVDKRLYKPFCCVWPTIKLRWLCVSANSMHMAHALFSVLYNSCWCHPRNYLSFGSSTQNWLKLPLTSDFFRNSFLNIRYLSVGTSILHGVRQPIFSHNGICSSLASFVL